MLVPRLRATLSFAIAAALVLALFISAPATGGLFAAPWDKVIHLGYFGCMTLLLAIGFGRERVVFAFAAAVLTGALDESYQAFLPGRHADWEDFLTDVAAAACAALIARHYLAGAAPTTPACATHGADGKPQTDR